MRVPGLDLLELFVSLAFRDAQANISIIISIIVVTTTTIINATIVTIAVTISRA